MHVAFGEKLVKKELWHLKSLIWFMYILDEKNLRIEIWNIKVTHFAFTENFEYKDDNCYLFEYYN